MGSPPIMLPKYNAYLTTSTDLQNDFTISSIDSTQRTEGHFHPNHHHHQHHPHHDHTSHHQHLNNLLKVPAKPTKLKYTKSMPILNASKGLFQL